MLKLVPQPLQLLTADLFIIRFMRLHKTRRLKPQPLSLRRIDLSAGWVRVGADVENPSSILLNHFDQDRNDIVTVHEVDGLRLPP